MPNGWEIIQSAIWREHWIHEFGYKMTTQPRLQPFQADGDLDPDHDKLPNSLEYQNGTRPDRFDSDRDALPDGFEARYSAMNPRGRNDRNGDADGDGLSNFIEWAYDLDPTVPEGRLDSDRDGLTNLEEVAFGSSLRDDDIDGDGLDDLEERSAGTNPWKQDSEEQGSYPGKIIPGDGLPDSWELYYGYNPNVCDDPKSDEDKDGLPLLEEYRQATHPRKRDTDRDGVTDGEEVTNNTDPKDPTWGGRPPAAPSKVKSETNADGSVTYTWADNSDNEEGFRIRQRQPDGTWKVVAECPPNTTSVTVWPEKSASVPD